MADKQFDGSRLFWPCLIPVYSKRFSCSRVKGFRAQRFGFKAKYMTSSANSPYASVNRKDEVLTHQMKTQTLQMISNPPNDDLADPIDEILTHQMKA